MHEPESMLTFLNMNLQMLHNRFFPLKFKKLCKNPWFNPEIERSMISRDIAYRLWKNSKYENDKKKNYKRLRNKVNYIISKAKINHDKQRFNVNLPTKQLWTNVKQLGISKTKPTSTSSEHSVNAINDYFSSNYTTCDHQSFSISPTESFGFRPVYNYEIINAVFSIKSNAVGLDNIPFKFIKAVLPLLLPLFAHLFNTIITTSHFPSGWKKIKVIPIAKKVRSTEIL